MFLAFRFPSIYDKTKEEIHFVRERHRRLVSSCKIRRRVEPASEEIVSVFPSTKNQWINFFLRLFRLFLCLAFFCLFLVSQLIFSSFPKWTLDYLSSHDLNRPLKDSTSPFTYSFVDRSNIVSVLQPWVPSESCFSDPGVDAKETIFFSLQRTMSLDSFWTYSYSLIFSGLLLEQRFNPSIRRRNLDRSISHQHAY